MAEDTIIDVTKVSEKGQVVIPKEIRDKMGFKQGTRLIVVASGDAVVLQRVEAVAGKVRMKDLMDRIKAITSKLGFG
ncbi:MAG: AbrB/MazE/SpoVT family DNA-binding domain-containing protein [Nitrososphaerales archaeon]|nr:AbrB/MazE/SpoVT family DNA-binding domain-containing protein [Nitrososphaerales archaeon]